METAEQLEITPSSGENLENRTIMVASKVEFKKTTGTKVKHLYDDLEKSSYNFKLVKLE